MPLNPELCDRESEWILSFDNILKRERSDYKSPRTLRMCRIQTIQAFQHDVVDDANMTKNILMNKPSVTLHNRKQLSLPSKSMTPTVQSAATNTVKRCNLIRKSTSVYGAGGIDEDAFMQTFEDVPKFQIFSGKELEEHLTKIKDAISNPSTDWSKRIEALKKMRSLLLAGASKYDEFWLQLCPLEVCFVQAVQNLRSQVVREACITIAFMAQELKGRLEHFAETLLPPLLNLIPNCARIMATSGVVAVRFIIAHVHSFRLLPVLIHHLDSKAREIRRSCCEFLCNLLHIWPRHILERHSLLLQDALRKGIMDADVEARSHARKAFWAFADHFQEQADLLLNSLDATHKKMVSGEGTFAKDSITTKSRTGFMSTSQDSLNRTKKLKHTTNGVPVSQISLRSNSAIDLAAAQRARARAEYAAQQRNTLRSNSKPMRFRTSDSDRAGRNVGSNSGMSQSQPSSRSTSPSYRLNCVMYSSPGNTLPSSRIRRRSGIPISTGSSREPSPIRNGSIKTGRTGSLDRSSVKSLACRDTNSGIEFSMVNNSTRYSGGSEELASNKDLKNMGSEWAFGRLLDRQHHDRESMLKDILLTCSSSLWVHRKEGLLGLQRLLHQCKGFSSDELYAITSCLETMFIDTHARVLPLLLEAIADLLRAHARQLHDWLPNLLQCLFCAADAELSAPMRHPIIRTLELVRKLFPPGLQLAAVFHFLSVNHSVRSCVCALNHLNSLLPQLTTSDIPVDANATLQLINSWSKNDSYPHLNQAAIQALEGLKELQSNEQWLKGVYKNQLSYVEHDQDSLANNDHSHHEVFKSLKKTTNEIQNYPFNRILSNAFDFKNNQSCFELPRIMETSVHKDNLISRKGMWPHITEIMKELNSPGCRRAGLLQLLQLCRNESSITELQPEFRRLLRILLTEALRDADHSVRTLVYASLTEMITSTSLLEEFVHFTELLILKVLEGHKDDEKEVARAAEVCAAALAGRLPPDDVTRVLNPIIQTGEYPINLAAIKMMTQLVEQQDSTVIENLVSTVVPSLIQAYDNEESSVRKSAVFCMVSFYKVLGESLRSHLQDLNGSKLKLLNLYIKRAQQNNN